MRRAIICPARARSALEPKSEAAAKPQRAAQSLMEIFRTVAELRQWSRTTRCDLGPRSFDRACAHHGRAARGPCFADSRRCGIVQRRSPSASSSTPRSLDPTKTYARYPRSFEADCALAEAEGADVIFAPSVEEIYPAGAATFVEVEGLSDRLDGSFAAGAFSRRGHGGGQAADCRRAGPGLLRAEGRGAGGRAAPHGCRSAPGDRDRGLPHRARARRPGSQLAQCVSESRGTQRRHLR